MTKYLIPIFTFILFLYGLLIFFSSFYWGIGVITFTLTFLTLTGLLGLLINRKLGLTIILIVTFGWLIRYFEHAAFLTLYDIQNIDRWLIVAIPIILSSIILFLSYTALQNIQKKTINLKLPALLIVGIAVIGLFSFVRKPHTKEFNCWYYFNNNEKEYKISFANTPEHFFETTTDSEELKNIILKHGIRDEFRPGIYCPETKVRVVTRFKKIVSVKIVGFHNTTTNHKATLNNPVELDINKIYGDKKILEPEFVFGD